MSKGKNNLEREIEKINNMKYHKVINGRFPIISYFENSLIGIYRKDFEMHLNNCKACSSLYKFLLNIRKNNETKSNIYQKQKRDNACNIIDLFYDKKELMLKSGERFLKEKKYKKARYAFVLTLLIEYSNPIAISGYYQVFDKN